MIIIVLDPESPLKSNSKRDNNDRNNVIENDTDHFESIDDDVARKKKKIETNMIPHKYTVDGTSMKSTLRHF